MIPRTILLIAFLPFTACTCTDFDHCFGPDWPGGAGGPPKTAFTTVPDSTILFLTDPLLKTTEKETRP